MVLDSKLEGEIFPFYPEVEMDPEVKREESKGGALKALEKKPFLLIYRKENALEKRDNPFA
jgi:hypothetical protein